MQQRIIDILQNLAHQHRDRQLDRGTWTVEIKTALVGSLANPKENIGAYAESVKPGTKTDWGEWLWDFVLAKHKSQERLEQYKLGMIDRLMLIGEIEWLTSYDQIALDFQKLVFGQADLKLYVYPKSSPENNRSIVKFCSDLTDVSSQFGGDKYLLIGMPFNAHGPDLEINFWSMPDRPFRDSSAL